MDRLRSVVVVVCLLGLSTGPVYASDSSSEMSFPSCGTVSNRNTSHQFGQFNWVE